MREACCSGKRRALRRRPCRQDCSIAAAALAFRRTVVWFVFVSAFAFPLSWESFELRFVAATPGSFPPFAGSAWRGGFGHALKRLVCVQRWRPCEGCALEQGCLFTTLFDPRHDGRVSLLGRVDRLPPPYVLDVLTPTPCELRKGDEFRLRLAIVGRVRHHAVYLLRALEEAAARGIGPSPMRFELAGLERLEPPSAPTSTLERLRVELLTPLRMRVDGRLLGPERFEPRLFLLALFRRLSLLAACWGEPSRPLPLEPVRDRLARLRAMVGEMHWVEQQRRSLRQHTRMRMGGLLGHFLLHLEPEDPLLPLLLAGEQLHLGKATTMGLGRYRLVPVLAGGAPDL